jgi:F-type H+-transporting ATPase subunit a
MATELAAEGAHQAAGHAPSASEYIIHHLTHFSSVHQTKIVDFSIINMDTLFWSITVGVIGSWLMWLAARRATSGVPGRFQAFVEMIVEMVEDQSKAIIHGDRSFIAPMALTVFVWVVLMNSMDFLPVDMFSSLLSAIGLGSSVPYQRIVPTADLNGTMGMALGVFALMIYSNLQLKGVGGFVHELFCAPFGAHPLLWIPNLALNIIEFIARTVSLAMRLFGNMYAGELIFLLIALLGSTATWWGFGMHVFAGTVWAIFHILIVILQAFIFMMLALVYVGQAHESH